MRTKGPSRPLRCLSMRSTLPYRTLPRVANCTSPCMHRTHAATFRCTPIPHRAHAVRQFLNAHLTRPSSRWGCVEPRRGSNCASGPARRALPFCHPIRFGRPRRPWPTCRCAWRCACAAATKRAHSTSGTPAATCQRHSISTLRFPRGTLGVCRYRLGTHGTLRSAECTAARACVRNDLTCCCRGSSCSLQ